MAVLKVLELGDYAAGYAGRLFAHQGADVVRVETPAREPAWASAAAMTLYLHANKRRVVDVSPVVMAQLAAQADVVICEGATASAVQATGFDEFTARAKVAVTPYGMTGPKRDWAATNNVLLAAGGYTFIMGDPDRAPLSLPGHYLDFQVGALAYAAAMAVLSGEDAPAGNTADIGKLETLMSMSQFTTVRYHCAGEIRTRHGSDYHFVTPSELFRCADGWVYVNIVATFWDAFALFLDRPEVLLDARFTTNDLRMENRDALHAIIAEALIDIPVAELGMRAAECRVPVGVVHTFDDVLGLEHLRTRGFWVRGRAAGQDVDVPGVPFRIDGVERPDLGVTSADREVPAW
ncbi:MAG: CoA transferase [Pseudomonadota bacterium]